jgi:hypothetical protein
MGQSPRFQHEQRGKKYFIKLFSLEGFFYKFWHDTLVTKMKFHDVSFLDTKFRNHAKIFFHFVARIFSYRCQNFHDRLQKAPLFFALFIESPV